MLISQISKEFGNSKEKKDLLSGTKSDFFAEWLTVSGKWKRFYAVIHFNSFNNYISRNFLLPLAMATMRLVTENSP